jgi:hypothetical protein
VEGERTHWYWACSHCHWTLPYDSTDHAPTVVVIDVFEQHRCEDHRLKHEQRSHEEQAEDQKKAS